MQIKHNKNSIKLPFVFIGFIVFFIATIVAGGNTGTYWNCYQNDDDQAFFTDDNLSGTTWNDIEKESEDSEKYLPENNVNRSGHLIAQDQFQKIYLPVPVLKHSFLLVTHLDLPPPRM